MLEQISNLVKEYGQGSIVNNPDIPNDQNNAVLAETTNTITSGMQNMLAGGGLQDIISLFTGGNTANNNTQTGGGGIAGLLKNPMVTMMIGHLVSKLIGKYNMSPQQASSVANNVIPNVIGDMVKRTNNNDPANDAFDLNDLIGSLTGGNSSNTNAGNSGFNFQDLLGKLTGGGGGNTGGFDLQDIISKVTQNAQQTQAKQTNEGSSIGDLIKGLFN